MKALLLTREYPPEVYGGAGVHVDYLSRELAKLIPVEVRTFGDQNVQTANFAVQGFRFAEAGLEGAAETFLPALQALRVCTGFLARPIDADVVHCHTWYAHFGGLLAKALYGIPLVVTAHSLEPLRPWKREQLGRGADLSGWIERAALEAADAIVAVSREMKADILRLFKVQPEKVHVIHNGIDTDEYRPGSSRGGLERYGIEPLRPYVLCVGRISRQKGILHLVNAIPHLDPAAQVVLCAASPDSTDIAKEVEEAVRGVAATRGGIVWVRQMVDRPTAIELYSHAAVFCCPSIYEPFGIINLEAMACETPVVASAVGGIPEVVVHGETGFLVPLEQQAESPFEPVHPDRFSRDLARAINVLLADAGLRQTMGTKGRRRAEALFSWRAIARQVRSLYESLVRT
ncbi:MAG: glycogen synthase [candidate division NC10 bacterium]|nr:glycogen synthase [candidate division NC10 bacterium]